MTERERVERALRRVLHERGHELAQFRYVLENDWTGEPMVGVWAIVRDDVPEMAWTRDFNEGIEDAVVGAMEEEGIERWVSVRFRTETDEREYPDPGHRLSA